MCLVCQKRLALKTKCSARSRVSVGYFWSPSFLLIELLAIDNLLFASPGQIDPAVRKRVNVLESQTSKGGPRRCMMHVHVHMLKRKVALDEDITGR